MLTRTQRGYFDDASAWADSTCCRRTSTDAAFLLSLALVNSAVRRALCRSTEDRSPCEAGRAIPPLVTSRSWTSRRARRGVSCGHVSRSDGRAWAGLAHLALETQDVGIVYDLLQDFAPLAGLGRQGVDALRRTLVVLLAENAGLQAAARRGGNGQDVGCFMVQRHGDLLPRGCDLAGLSSPRSSVQKRQASEASIFFPPANPGDPTRRFPASVSSYILLHRSHLEGNVGSS